MHPGVQANDTDPNGLPLNSSVVTQPAHGSLTLNADGSFTYFSQNGYSGPDSFTYQDSDGSQSSNVATVSLNIAAVLPVANNDSATTNANTAKVIAVLANDTVVYPAVFDYSSVAITQAALHGSLVIDPSTGNITYTPANGYTGPDSFAYTVTDNYGHTSNAATVTLSVLGTSVGSLSGTQATAASSYNLTSLGTSDWAHWGTGGSNPGFNHKANGGSKISNYTQIGSGGSYGGGTNASRNVTWSDGTPLASDSGDHGYLWDNGAVGSGFSFTVPASTTAQTLVVYAGGYGASSTLTAHLSDGTPDYVATVNATTNTAYADVYTITFKAALAGQTLTISYVKSGNIPGKTNGSADLIAAYLSGSVTLTAPVVTTNPTSQSVTAGTSVNFTAAASGNPTPTVQWQLSVGRRSIQQHHRQCVGDHYDADASVRCYDVEREPVPGSLHQLLKQCHLDPGDVGSFVGTYRADDHYQSHESERNGGD